MRPTVAVVLPPREAFSPQAAGAIGLLVHRLSAGNGAFAPVVLGPPHPAPFAGVTFEAVKPALWPGSLARRYAGGVLRAVLRRRPALVEVHNRPDVALFLAERLPGVPVSLFLHNDPQGMRAARSPAERARLIAALAGIATVSAYLRGRLLEGVITPAHVPEVLANCIDLRAIPPATDPRDPEILFAGRVVSDKGADSFVAACALALPQLPGWRGTIIGADRFGPDSPQTRFLRALRPHADAAGVTLRGYLPHAEVLAAMAQAAIVVVPSRWPEPFGLTALEAMAAGAALVCSDRGGLAEVPGPEAAVVIDPDDPAAIAAALLRLARDPAVRVRLSQAGRRRAALFDVAEARPALDAMRTRLVGSEASAPLYSGVADH